MAGKIHNAFREKIRCGEVAATLSVRMVRTNEVVVMAKTAGFDGVMFDMEHSTFDLDNVSQLCIAALAVGITPLVRAPSIDASIIARILDGGALGVIVPHVKTVKEVQAIVQAAKFPPVGNRSEMGAMPHFQFRPVPATVAFPVSNEATLAIPMIETLEALEAVDDIAAVPGVDALFLGGSDLTAEMGISGDYDNPRFVSACDRVIAAGNRHNVIVGLGGLQSRPDLIERFSSAGARWVSAATDSGLFLGAAVQKSKEVRDLNERLKNTHVVR